MLRFLAFVAACFVMGALFSACGAIGGNPLQIENRLACTLARDKMYVIGSAGFFGGAAPINSADAAAACFAASAPASSASGVK